MMKVTTPLYILILLIIGFQANAQVNPHTSMFYQNQYLANPAMAAVEKGLTLNALYNHGFIGENEGTGLSNVFTAEYQANAKMGIGLNVNTDKDGLLNINRYAVSYAYHLPVNENNRLHFGISAGITTERLSFSDIIGDTDDQLAYQYNQADPYFDADLGIAYIAKEFTVQAVVPNLRSIFYDIESTVYTPSTFYTAISYKYKTENVNLEPKLVYRGLKNFDNVIDAGLNATLFDDKFNVLGMYHSTNNITFGIGYEYQKQFQFQIAYNTPINSNLTKYTSGNVELALKVNLFRDTK